ncbi:CPBP family intramembrane metalloprotease [Flavobacterium sp. SM15]|uniref:CPBP family intramembrane glutamic endopeptidase n=1 Tax=Flavobacterium sp. SM15 TaxID=2908005 RepID=UPI001EDBAD66|nr:CPBP family intramembrane glutamic endopeptidase [Flavobacterium sp. SM15]MCG2611823.1 CPBP family intramembrane metalloprotease [Flavobacterium sp. SM15]
MKLSEQIRVINWLRILLFYGIILLGTYFARKLPNLLKLLLEQISDVSFSFNYNHGFVTLIVSLLFYHFSKVEQKITLFGNNKMKSILFPVILFSCYSIYGMNNGEDINKHSWAFIICSFALVYNIMEEYAWRGYLIESLGKTNYVIKSLVSGVFWCAWHLLVFSNFDQYGGFWIFFAFCIIFAFILTFAVSQTRSILVTATIHAFIIQINIIALICFIVFILLLLTWNKQLFKSNNGS